MDKIAGERIVGVKCPVLCSIFFQTDAVRLFVFLRLLADLRYFLGRFRKYGIRQVPLQKGVNSSRLRGGTGGTVDPDIGGLLRRVESTGFLWNETTEHDESKFFGQGGLVETDPDNLMRLKKRDRPGTVRRGKVRGDVTEPLKLLVDAYPLTLDSWIRRFVQTVKTVMRDLSQHWY